MGQNEIAKQHFEIVISSCSQVYGGQQGQSLKPIKTPTTVTCPLSLFTIEDEI